MKVKNINLLFYSKNLNNIKISAKFVLGETDWKIITIDVNDPLANQMNGEKIYVLLKNSLKLYVQFF